MLFALSSVVHSRSVSVLGREPRRNAVTPPPLNECAYPPRDSCSFYADCLEAGYHCGQYGYPIGYGQKYCQRFSDDRSELSARGQEWMLDTMHCLQTQLIPEATGAVNTTCDAIKDKAFGTHAMCYVDSGVCLLPPSDWVAIVDIVGITTLFSSWDAFEATLEAGEGCVELWAYLIEQKL